LATECVGKRQPVVGIRMFRELLNGVCVELPLQRVDGVGDLVANSPAERLPVGRGCTDAVAGLGGELFPDCRNGVPPVFSLRLLRLPILFIKLFCGR